MKWPVSVCICMHASGHLWPVWSDEIALDNFEAKPVLCHLEKYTITTI